MSTHLTENLPGGFTQSVFFTRFTAKLQFYTMQAQICLV